MSHVRTFSIALLLALVSACASEKSEKSNGWLDRFGPFHGLTGPDAITMDVALLETPIGDRFINQDLWTVVDEQVVALEGKASLEDNGFRVGQVGGVTPPGLQTLLTSRRSCIDPKRLQIRSNTPTPIALGPAVRNCRFEVHQAIKTTSVALPQARCLLELVPSASQSGRIIIHFTPVIEHGQTALLPQPATDLSRWELREQTPTERYPALGWDVSLSPNEYVIVGARFEKAGTLGHACFIRSDVAPPVQRLLVIRAYSSSTAEDPEASVDGAPARKGSVPLALQAGWPEKGVWTSE